MNRVGLLVGTAFGFLIGAARLNDYDVIHNMLLLREPDVFLMMASAVLTAVPLLWLLQRRRWRTPLGGPIRVSRSRPERHNVLGAMVFGTGWAVAGACPGPALALPAAGSLLGLPVLFGIFAGVLLRESVAARASGAQPAPSTIPTPAVANQ